MSLFRATALAAGVVTSILAGCGNGAPDVSRESASSAGAARLSRAKAAASRVGSPFAPARPRATAPIRADASKRRHHHGPFPGPPQVETSGATPMEAPRVVPVFYSGYTYQSQVESFLGKLGASAFWSALGEYGVKSLSITPSVIRTDAPPASPVPYTDLEQWLSDKITSGDPLLPALDDHTIYALFLPPGMQITNTPGQPVKNSCKDWGAYHSDIYLPSGAVIAYLAIPSCEGYLGYTGIDFITDAASHEIVEATTDPSRDVGGGYAAPNAEATDLAFAAEGGAGMELGDACEFQPNVGYVPADLGFRVQRFWSNESAAAWKDPCVPIAVDQPYFNVQPLIGGTEPVALTYAKGVTIQPGEEATIPLHLYSDRPTSAWTLSATEEPNPHLAPDPYNLLSFSFDRPTGKDGDIRYLTIKRAKPPAGVTPTFLRFAIHSTLGALTNTWWVIVGQ
jgi:hypothetical protein